MKPVGEFVLSPDVRGAFDPFCALLGIRIAFLTADGLELVSGRQKPICDYCRRLRRRPGGESLCRALDRRRRQECAQSRRLVAYVCHGGLHEAIVPVFDGARMLGYIMIGQFRSVHALPAQSHGGRQKIPHALREAFARVPNVPPRRVPDVLALFDMLVQYVTLRHLIGVRDVVGPILTHFREHPDEPLSLAAASSLAHRSPSTISHVFRRKTGQSFKHAQIVARLERADTCFREAPGITVREVAFKLGYRDPLYFSRLYRKYRGVPPSRFNADLSA
ncbi:MAG: PocR ligand-binding domain-containing protein [Kiritimatiellae bacterium]|nr:PocR ligand-binding domain-containing protein [Kiritimatiellia bacterium]